jgi:hypothetical protein
MITTALGLANLALTHLGQKKIAAIDTTTELGRKVDTIYDPAVYETLRDIKPNFAKKRAIFHHAVQSEKTITGATAADPCVITVAAHGLSNGDTIAIWDVAGMTDLNGKRYIIRAVTTNTMTLTDENGNDIDASEYDAYTSGGKCGLVSAAPEFGYAYRYTLPTDYIILLEVNGNDYLDLDHSIENGELLTDEATIKARYVYANTTVSNWDVDFIMLCSYKMAEFLAMSITNLKGLADHWRNVYMVEKAKAKGAKSQESGTNSGPQRVAICNQWTKSRTGS